MISERKDRCVMNAISIPRRLLLGSAVGALALRPSRTAQADTTFTNFSFAATGAPAVRTMPDRLSDIVNVKDWGALGNGRNDDSTAIQQAINYCIERGGGKVFFPPGGYRLYSSALTVGSSNSAARVELIGSGRDNTFLNCAKAGAFVISSDTQTYDCIGRVEGFGINGDYGIKVTGKNVIISDLNFFQAYICIDASQADGVLISNINGISHRGASNVTADNPTPWYSTSDIGFCLGNRCTVVSCRLDDYYIAYSIGGYGSSVIGCAAENHVNSCRFGWAPSFTMQTTADALSGSNVLTFASLPNGGIVVGRVISATNIPAGTTISAFNPISSQITLSSSLTGNILSGSTITFTNECPAIGCMLQDLQTERCNVGIDLYNAQGCLIQGNAITGNQSLTLNQAIQNITWGGSPGTATVTVATPHNLAAGSQWLFFSGPSQFQQFAQSQFIFATRTGANTFTYPLASNPGAYTTKSASWNYPLQNALRCRIVTETAIIANVLAANVAYGSVDLDYNGQAQHRNNVFMGELSGWGWVMPTVSGNLGGWHFQGVGNATQPAYAPVQIAGPAGRMHFADLPGQFSPPAGQTYYQGAAIEGQEYDIVDGQKSASPGVGATWNDIVIGGGSGRYRVRYDGADWRRIG
jgi:hypothetical protein